MSRKTHRRATHRSKSHKRRHSRRHTRKNGGGCTSCTMRGQWGGRGGLGGSELGHAYTTGASQTLYQMTGRTPGLSSGGSRASQKRRKERLAQEAAIRNTERAIINAERRNMIAAIAQNAASKGRKRTRRLNFKKAFVMGMPITGYEGNEYKHLSRNEMKNKIREEALSEYVHMFGNNEGFNEINLELNNNKNNHKNHKKEEENDSDSDSEDEYENMGNVIIPGNNNLLKNLRKKSKKNKKN
jgi:hypothetical protein